MKEIDDWIQLTITDVFLPQVIRLTTIVDSVELPGHGDDQQTQTLEV